MFCWTAHLPNGIVLAYMVSPVFIRPALAISVAATIIFIVIAISRNGSNHPAPAQSVFKQIPRNIDISLKQVRFSEIKDGSVAWELVAERVDYDKIGEIARLTGGIRMEFIGKRPRGAVIVTAKSGEYRSNNNNIKLYGQVSVQMEDGARFDTDSIDYTAATSQFNTSDMVTFRQERLTLGATGMEIDVKNQKARFFKMVDATVAGVAVRGADKR